MEKLYGNAVVGQSGGPTAAINATLSGVITGVLKNKDMGIKTLYGMHNGMQGLMNEDLVNLSEIFAPVCPCCPYNEEKISLLKQTPAAALGSCRMKLKDPETDREFYEKLISIFKKYDIRYFFYIGGNDSMDTIAKLSKYLKTSDYEMRCIGVPKTIDNDLMCTDHTPGFGSASKYIAVTMQEILRDCNVYKVKAVTIVEIMGRDAGWLTASAGVLKRISDLSPDFIYLPERNFTDEQFLSDVKGALEKKDAVVIAISEGIRYENGHYVGEGTQSGAADVFGHKYLAGAGKALEHLVKEKIGCKVRSIELNLPQRCASHIASKTDIDESCLTGEAGVKYALDGMSAVMVTINRKNTTGYETEFSPKDIYQIANAVRGVPDEYINAEGNDVTDACIGYVLPLIQGETEVSYKNGVPSHIIL